MKLDSEATEQIPNNLDLFSSKPVNVAFQDTNVVEYNPVNAVGTWPTKFTVNTGSSYCNLSHCFLQTTFKIFKNKSNKDKDAKDVSQLVPITKDDKVSFINGFGATAIKNMKVLFNGRQVYNSNDLYSYNAYFRRRLGLETSRNSEDLQLAGYFEDDDESQMSGAGFENRRDFFIKNGEYHTITQIDADIFRQNKLLINMLTIDIEITMQPMNFSVIAQDAVNYVAVASGHKLYIKQHHLLPSLDATINQSLAQGQLAKYPYTRSLVSIHFIGPGRHDYNTTLFTDYVPKRVFVALVDASAFKGAPLLSPFEFKPFGLDRIHVSVNNKIVPTYPYDLGRKEFARAFKDLTDNTTNTGLTYQKYLTHSCIFAFDFQHYHSDKAIDPQQTGTTALSLKFASAVPTSGIQAIVYSEFDSIISFDFARNNTTALPV